MLRTCTCTFEGLFCNIPTSHTHAHMILYMDSYGCNGSAAARISSGFYRPEDRCKHLRSSFVTDNVTLPQTNLFRSIGRTDLDSTMPARKRRYATSNLRFL